MLRPRVRLASLWFSQVARILADNCLRVVVVLELASQGAWHLVAALFVLPSVFLAPLNGALSNSLPKRRVLIATAAYCLGVVVFFSLLNGPWLWCLALVAIGNALFSPTRYAMLPAAARDTHLPLTRVNGWIEMGSVGAIVAGMMLGGLLHACTWEQLAQALPAFSGMAFLEESGLTVALALILGLNVLCLATAWPVAFAADVYRPDPPGRALLGFFRDSRRIWREKETRSCLLALACLRGLVLVVPGALLASASDFDALVRLALWIMVGAAVGSLLAGVQRHTLRALGLVPFAAASLLLALLWASQVDPVPNGLCVFLGAMGGLINVPLFATYQDALPADARGNGIAVLNTAGYLCMTTLSLTLFTLAQTHLLSPAGQMGVVILLAAVGAGVAWRNLLREAYEQSLEFLFWPIYRIRGHGPGLVSFPSRGPVLILANHSAWFDPIFLGKVVPRQMTAMLTSAFYDKPILHYLARNLVHAIRVELSHYRRHAPELAEAIAALDRGEAVLLFPEGQLRKRADQPLHYFGRGVWHILKERPHTPVVVCWIEGAWGSYTSYYGGKPTKNKRPDFWRRIDVGVSRPFRLDAALLADHRATRNFLVQECLAARRHLGLEPLPAPRREVALTPDEPD